MIQPPCKVSEIGKAFQVRTLDKPTITPKLNNKVVEAYKYVKSIYSFLTPDIEIGRKTFDLGGASRTGLCRYEKSFNSVLLGTMLNALINGSMIYFGPPGSGKTTTPEVVGQVIFGLTLKQIEDATIPGHPNLTEEKMTLYYDLPKLMKGIKDVLCTSWVSSFFRGLDEVNRIPPEITSILLQAIDRRRVSYAGQSFDIPIGPIFATANYFDAGNFELTRPFLDRFGISVQTEGLNPQELHRIMGEEVEIDRQSFALSQEEREQVFAEIHSIPIEDNTLKLLSHTNSGLSSCALSGNRYFDKHKGRFRNQALECEPDKCGFKPEKVLCSQINEQGETSRSVNALRDYSRAFAWFLNRQSVNNEIMKNIFGLVYAHHRLSPSRIALNGGESAEGVRIDKSLFTRATFDFTHHLWDMGGTTFEAQNKIYSEIDRFYADIAARTKSARGYISDVEDIMKNKVDAMEDPAKWDILKALNAVYDVLEEWDTREREG